MQDNTVDAAGDSCTIRGRPCTSHGVIDCVGVVFGVFVAPASVLSRGCLFAGQRQPSLWNEDVGIAHMEIKSIWTTYYDNVLKGYRAKVPLCRVIQFDCEDWSSKSFIH